MKDIRKYLGCLLGGAVGDALGYSVEFLQIEQILSRFGKHGIMDYVLVDDVAQISDDTQMTLYTPNGLLFGTTRGMTRGIMEATQATSRSAIGTGSGRRKPETSSLILPCMHGSTTYLKCTTGAHRASPAWTPS